MRTFVIVVAMGCLNIFVSPTFGDELRKREPAISAEEAIKLARHHLKAHNVDVSKQYPDSIHLEGNLPPSAKAPRWRLVWEMKEYVKGGQTVVFVSMDKTVELGFGE